MTIFGCFKIVLVQLPHFSFVSRRQSNFDCVDQKLPHSSVAALQFWPHITSRFLLCCFMAQNFIILQSPKRTATAISKPK